MTVVVLRNYDNLLNVEMLRLRYQAQKWREENKDYDPNDEMVLVYYTPKTKDDKRN